MAILELIIHAFAKDSDLRSLVERCDLRIKNWEILADASPRDLPSFDSQLKIHCKADSCYSHDEFEAYSSLQRKWNEVTNNLCQLSHRPRLLLRSNRAFTKCSAPAHERVVPRDLLLGTLAWPSQFYCSFRIDNFSCNMNFYHDVRNIEIKVSTQLGGVEKLLRLHYSNIREILVSHNGSIIDLYITLVNPPLLYDIEKRSIHIPGKGRITLENEKRTLEIPTLLPATILGKSTALKIGGLPESTAKDILSRLYFRSGKIPVYHVAMVTTPLQASYLPGIFFLHDFKCSYLLEALLRRSFIVQIQNTNAWETFKLTLIRCAAKSSEVMQKTMIQLLYLLDDGVWLDYSKDIVALFDKNLRGDGDDENEKRYIVPARTRSVARAVLTPTRLILFPPEFMAENRILRNFDSDFSLRVSFRDDNFMKLSLQASFSNENIFNEAIRKPMLQGIVIGSRNYKFLAWSNSQIRDHGVWLYATDQKGTDASSIREWMGDFSMIRSVSKCMARMGQCFSQTEDAMSIPVEKIRTVDDIMGGRSPCNGKPYCFSDGIGKISKQLADKVFKTLRIKPPCSAFQIRFAGYKGMLTIDPELTAVDIEFRQSMLKFSCPKSTRLEIVKTTTAMPLFLNRPFITILDFQGVPTVTFLKLQEKMIRSLTDMLLDEDKAADYLQSQCILKTINFPDLAKSGVALTKEVFFRNMLLALHRRDVDGIKSKARLAIDPSLGRNMFGVLDETSTLEYGQVFAQYTKDINTGGSEDTEILKGPVLVTKNPCLQPGDVRMLTAVDCKRLHHIKDCLVFPQNGPRPQPNELSGSDLDGDEYTIIWQEDLFFSRNASAEHFPSPQEQLIYHPVEEADMVECLCKYIQNDQLGLIASAHLAFANDKKFGLGSSRCKLLAQKHSISVDFAKFGQTVKLEKDERPKEYPDFLEKGGRSHSFRSKHALGILYRVSRDFLQSNQYASMVYHDIQCDPDLLYPGWEKYQESATHSKELYNRLLDVILSTYGVVNESEAMTKAFSKLHSRLQERKDRAEVESMITGSIKALWGNIRKDFWEEFQVEKNLEDVDDSENEKYSEEVLKKASAWYAVTYNESNPKFLSFPWIVAKELATMKVARLVERDSWPPPSRPQVENLESIVQNSNIPLTVLSHEELQQIKGCGSKIEIATLVLGAKIIRYWDKQVCNTYRRKQLHSTILVKLFLHAIATKEYSEKPQAMDLFLDYLRYTLSLRFLETREAKQMVPFYIEKSKLLGKMCMNTYHQIACDGNLSCFRISKEIMYDEIETDSPTLLAPEITGGLSDQTVKDLLIHWSGVSVVNIRPHHRGQGSLITARGSTDAVRNLVEILQKESNYLKMSFIRRGLYH